LSRTVAPRGRRDAGAGEIWRRRRLDQVDRVGLNLQCFRVGPTV
jgi:hypothetical protein